MSDTETGTGLTNEEQWADARDLGEQVHRDPEGTKKHDDYLAQGDNRTVEPRQTQQNVASTTTGDVAGAYDPGGYTIDDVKEYVTANPDQRDAIYEAEQSGKARSTLLDWFDTQTTT